MKLSDQIEEFWKWFVENRQVIEIVIGDQGHPKTETIIQALDQHILGMGKLKWELGNPQPGQFTFTLSPNNDHELLKITKSIMSTAPEYPDWSFFHASPATGGHTLQVYDDNRDVCDIDAKPWRAALIPSGLGQFRILIHAENIKQLDEDTRSIAVSLMLTALVGEEVKINKLTEFELVSDFNSAGEQDSFSILQLSSFL